MIVETDSKLEGNVLGNENIPTKKKRYVVTTCNFESEDIFDAKKFWMETFPILGDYEESNEQFENAREVYIEDRDVRKEIQEALDRIKHLEELVQNYEQKDKERGKNAGDGGEAAAIWSWH